MFDNGIFISGETLAAVAFIGWSLFCYALGILAGTRRKKDE